MRKNCLLAALACILSLSALATAQSAAETQALADLAGKISGKVVYASAGKLYKVAIGSTQPTEIPLPTGVTPGWVRWSNDGTKVTGFGWFSNARTSKLFVVDEDGGNFKELVTQSGTPTNGYFLGFGGDFLPGDEEIIYCVNNQFDAVDIATSTIRHVTDVNGNGGEICLSRDGSHAATRSQQGSLLINLQTNDVVVYGGDCSPLVSADGALVASNANGHATMPFWDAAGNAKFTLNCTSIISPENKWDNFAWSNHDNYICVQGDDGLNEVYVLKLDRATGTAGGTRVTFGANALYPDLWVAGQATPSKSILTPASQNRGTDMRIAMPRHDGLVTVDLGERLMNSASAISVFQANGTLVKRLNPVYGTTISWDSRAHASGWYVIRISDRDRTSFVKVGMGR